MEALGIHDGATDKLDFLTLSFVAAFCKLWIGRDGAEITKHRICAVCLECFCV